MCELQQKCDKLDKLFKKQNKFESNSNNSVISEETIQETNHILRNALGELQKISKSESNTPIISTDNIENENWITILRRWYVNTNIRINIDEQEQQMINVHAEYLNGPSFDPKVMTKVISAFGNKKQKQIMHNRLYHIFQITKNASNIMIMLSITADELNESQ